MVRCIKQFLNHNFIVFLSKSFPQNHNLKTANELNVMLKVIAPLSCLFLAKIRQSKMARFVVEFGKVVGDSS